MPPQERVLKTVLDRLERAERQDEPAEKFSSTLAAALIFAELLREQKPGVHTFTKKEQVRDEVFVPALGRPLLSEPREVERTYACTDHPDRLVDIIFDKHMISPKRLFQAALGLETLMRSEVVAVAGLAREYLLRHS